MEQKIFLQFDLIQAKMGYLLASLASYSSLDLSKRTNQIRLDFNLIKLSLKENINYIDIRNVVILKNANEELVKRIDNDNEVYLSGHKVACLFFELSTLVKMLIEEVSKENILDDLLQYLYVASEYFYNSARVVNIELMCFEEKIIKGE